MADRILIDPVATVTLGTDVSNVDVVIIDDRIQKRDGHWWPACREPSTR